MDKINYFADHNFFDSAEKFFKDLNIPLKSIDNQPYRPEDFLTNTYNPHSTSHSLVDKAFLFGIVDDDAFVDKSQYDSLKKIAGITSDYDGLAVVGIELKTRENNLLPTRSQLAEITRAVNREFLYTPVTVLFKYGEFLALANAERTSFLVKYKEGEKVGKVSLLRDVNFTNPHTGHLQILRDLRRPDKIQTFTDLYKHWADVFNVNVLNKKFYLELSNWYFWAIQNVTFPGQPTLDDALLQGKDFKDLKQQHNATNVIRMLTRLLFVWFMKEKKLIPDELFELQNLQSDILNEIAPFHEVGLYTESNKDSVYYKAILQNLFFATLNCPINADSSDKRQRGFRGPGYGTHRGIDWMMRYKNYFKDPDAFLQKMNNTVPFLNGGLFECLDNKDLNIYVDGFSDQMTKGEHLVVPDYLFFGIEEAADLSDVIGIADKKTKNSAVKGLINILKSYKFTIAENTPIEEEVALDPELLGKVFENLLASYNPETKTTARKQTGSFYTPREIVNYMVDESLITYLKNKIQSDESSDELDQQLHQLVTYNSENPFAEDPKTTREILKYMDECTILDPACGSGAFPMGVLQKMVHILDKLDPDNKIWKELQIDKAKKESDEAFEIADKKAREDRLIEINEAFDQDINNPDYARKLFLIENCIYGVDIQPIATQISKLRFFISLVVEQHVDGSKDNFGIRPLPNLETKFVAANTLIGIEKENTLFSTKEIKDLESELKKVRNKLFGARSKDTKNKYRADDAELRLKIADKLKENGFPVASAEKLASWDPFDQNASSSFFDPEWMFDIKDGFDILIGNPPYINIKEQSEDIKSLFRNKYNYSKGADVYVGFIERSYSLIKKNGILYFIVPNKFFGASYGKAIRSFLKNDNFNIINIWDLIDEKVFENASISTVVVGIQKTSQKGFTKVLKNNRIKIIENLFDVEGKIQIEANENDNFLLSKMRKNPELHELADIRTGIMGFEYWKMEPIINNSLVNDSVKLYTNGNLRKYEDNWETSVIKLYKDNYEKPSIKLDVKYLNNNTIKLFNHYPKIVVRGVAKEVSAIIDESGAGLLVAVHTIIPKELNIKYLLAIINSKLINWFHLNTIYSIRIPEGSLKYPISFFSTLPIAIAEESTIEKIKKLVDKRLAMNVNIDPSNCEEVEKEIDSMIYNIYNLSAEEINMVISGQKFS